MLDLGKRFAEKGATFERPIMNYITLWQARVVSPPFSSEGAAEYADEIHTFASRDLHRNYCSVPSHQEKLEAFAEWDAIYQIDGSERGPRHYAVGGLVYFISPNFNRWSRGSGIE
jgi:hypothetical protein